MSSATDALLKAAKAVLVCRNTHGIMTLGPTSYDALRALIEAVRKVEDENRQGPP